MSYKETIDYLYNLQLHGIRPGLARIATLMSILDHPEAAFQSVHIAGTNGKGSTAAMVASVLTKSGYRVGLYTSPHLIDFSERIRICGLPISEEAIIRLTETIRAKMEIRSPRLAKKITFFEFTSALAFLYFAENEVEFAVVEVGMGGRFDATNCLKPLVTAITQIDFDHERYLGTTLLEIAREKAGVIKKGVPLVTGVRQAEVSALIEKTAQSLQAPLFRLGKEIRVSAKAIRNPAWALSMELYYEGSEAFHFALNLLGRHQADNAALALGIIERLQEQGILISKTDITDGFKQTQTEGRLEVIQTHPIILLDVAHNPSGTRVLADYLKETEDPFFGKRWLIAGVMRDKNIKEILRPLLACADEVVLTRPNMDRAALPQDIASGPLAELMAEEGRDDLFVSIRDTIAEALADVESRIQSQDRLVITGSCFTVGEARAEFLGTRASPIRG